MHKSTVWLAALCLLLASALGFAAGWLVNRPAAAPQVAGTEKLPIGLPAVRSGQPRQTLKSDSALLWDANAQVIRFEQNGFERRPIASITKLMTAMVALDMGVDWDKPMEILPDEYGAGGQLMLSPGESIAMRDLMYVSLIASANNTTLALVRGLGVSEEKFVEAMNRKAIRLGLEQTTLVDSTGLNPGNISTAYEVARLAEAAWRDYPTIADIASRKDYTFTIGGSHREHTVRNSNKLISRDDLAVTGSKTGYLDEAGYCLVMRGKGKDKNKISVVLGSGSERDNLTDSKTLLGL